MLFCRKMFLLLLFEMLDWKKINEASQMVRNTTKRWSAIEYYQLRTNSGRRLRRAAQSNANWTLPGILFQSDFLLNIEVCTKERERTWERGGVRVELTKKRTAILYSFFRRSNPGMTGIFSFFEERFFNNKLTSFWKFPSGYLYLPTGLG